MSHKQSFSIGYLRRALKREPIEVDSPLYEQLQDLGFEHDGMWIVNPYWSSCGRFEVEPLEEYGDKFLNSGIAAMLGFMLPQIIPAGVQMLAAGARRKHEIDLMQKIRAGGEISL